MKQINFCSNFATKLRPSPTAVSNRSAKTNTCSRPSKTFRTASRPWPRSSSLRHRQKSSSTCQRSTSTRWRTSSKIRQSQTWHRSRWSGLSVASQVGLSGVSTPGRTSWRGRKGALRSFSSPPWMRTLQRCSSRTNGKCSTFAPRKKIGGKPRRPCPEFFSKIVSTVTRFAKLFSISNSPFSRTTKVCQTSTRAWPCTSLLRDK